METRKEIRELHRMACPILCHYVLTSLFEMFDQAIIGQNSTRGFALVGIASVVPAPTHRRTFPEPAVY